VAGVMVRRAHASLAVWAMVLLEHAHIGLNLQQAARIRQISNVPAQNASVRQQGFECIFFSDRSVSMCRIDGKCDDQPMLKIRPYGAGLPPLQSISMAKARTRQKVDARGGNDNCERG
jgi:hypothetical protein